MGAENNQGGKGQRVPRAAVNDGQQSRFLNTSSPTVRAVRKGVKRFRSRGWTWPLSVSGWFRAGLSVAGRVEAQARHTFLRRRICLEWTTRAAWIAESWFAPSTAAVFLLRPAVRHAKRGNIVSTVELTGWRNSYKIPVDRGATRRL